MKKSENILENAVLEEGTRGRRMLEALQHCRMLHNEIDYSLFIIAIGVKTFTYMRAQVRTRVVYVRIQYVRARVYGTSSCKLRRQLPALAAWLSCALTMACFEALSCALS